MTPDTDTAKDANTLAHEKVLRLEALKLSVYPDKPADRILEDAKKYAAFVLVGEQ